MVIKTLAEKYRKLPGQIVLKWALQRKSIIILETAEEENLARGDVLFDFELTEEEMTAIN